MRLIVLAGGLGSRLRTAVANVPKALAPVEGLPFLHFQIENWISQGLRQFTFLLHHQAAEIIAFLQSMKGGLLKDCQTDWLVEPVPLDTGGAVANAVKTLSINDDFLMTNADTWLGGGICEMMESYDPAMAVINMSDVSRYGRVYINNCQLVSAFTEKNGESTSGWISAGMYHLSADLFKNWNSQPFSLERELFPVLVKNSLLTAVPLKTNFLDIGVPVDYYRFCRWIAAGRHDPL
jgi:D-glycero-alpha-D-manno-heptose 1-phosphate guanylyltransferase